VSAAYIIIEMRITPSFLFVIVCLYVCHAWPSMYPSIDQTGIIQHYSLVITREILPGSNRYQVAVNGTTPGPLISVTLGNTVEVTVINYIFDDSTTIHWHGMDLHGSPWMDGIINITQCPISNRKGYNQFTYSFTPSVAGTFWYHGHYHSQQPDGK
jgi:FtsP/CotA-like multicopper oxidase with cupredoxin domain